MDGCALVRATAVATRAPYLQGAAIFSLDIEVFQDDRFEKRLKLIRIVVCRCARGLWCVLWSEPMYVAVHRVRYMAPKEHVVRTQTLENDQGAPLRL